MDSNKHEKAQTDPNINTGGGAYVGKGVNTGGGDFVGRDQVKTVGVNLKDVTEAFKEIYTAIETHPSLSPADKDDLKVDIEEIQKEVAKNEDVDESFLARRFRNIKRMAPDILDVVLATLANPKAGFSTVVTKIANKVKETTASNA